MRKKIKNKKQRVLALVLSLWSKPSFSFSHVYQHCRYKQSCFNKVGHLQSKRGGRPPKIINAFWCHDYMRPKFNSFELCIWALLKTVFLSFKKFFFYKLRTKIMETFSGKSDVLISTFLVSKIKTKVFTSMYFADYP